MINYSASIKISQLDSLTGSAITGNDFFPIVDSGSLTTKKISLNNFSSYLFNTASIVNNKNLIFQSGSALTGSNNINFDYTTNILYVSNSIQTQNITASLKGTSSYANTASLALTASYVAASTTTNAISSSYISGSNGVLNNFYLNVTGQKTSAFYPQYNNTDSGLYFTSNTANKNAIAEIYLAQSGSNLGTNDLNNNVGVWINGIYNNDGTSLPIYLGGNPSNTPPLPSLTINSVGNVSITNNLNVNGVINAKSITSSLYGTASVANNVSNIVNQSYTSSYINYTGQNTGTSSYALTSSYASGSNVFANSSSYAQTASYAQTSNNGPKFIAPYLITSSANVIKPWTTFNTLSVSGINSTGSAGIIQYSLKTGATGPFNLYFRPTSSVNYAYTASLGAAIESQMIIPLNSLGAFDYALSCSSATFSIKLVGYY
jgi:hypothetical protein